MPSNDFSLENLDLIPRNKHDLEAVDRAIKKGFTFIKSCIPSLLEWVQDINWPVAQKLAPFLATIAQKIENEIRYVFKTNDYIWQYWILSEIIGKMNPSERDRFNDILFRLRDHSTIEEQKEELHIIANDILKEN